MAEDAIKVSLNIPFPSSDAAHIAYEVLSVDKELKNVQRSISINGENLVVKFESNDFKTLRVTVNGFLKSVILVTKTMCMFHGN